MNIYELSQIQAAHDVLNKTDLYFHRKVCRWYSHQFHTPLHSVINSLEVEWSEILTHYYEYHYDKMEHNELLKVAKQFLPDIVKEEEQSEDDFISNLLEQDRIKKQSLNKSTPKSILQNSPTTISEEVKFFDVDESEEQ